MRGYFRKKLAELSGCTSGNATLIVALGMPMLIGGAGLGVDVAQWYMWKRELQYAVDQAAIAGAWAQVDEATADTYVSRARQEFNANLAVTEGTTTTPAVSLANYAGGVNNSVAVSASSTRALPFSNLITGESATIGAYAQATFEEGVTFTSCLIAVDEDADGAITIGGSSILTASCGLAALSDSDTAITVNGDPEVDAGWILARGGIDDWFSENTDDVILEDMAGLYDPFEDLEPPEPAESLVARQYTCETSPATYTADKTVVTNIHYTYYQGSNSNSWSLYDYSNAKDDASDSVSYDDMDVPSGTTAGTTTTTSRSVTRVAGQGSTSVWEVKTTTVTTTTSDLRETGGTVAGSVIPGTYTSINTSCDTTFSTGVYIIDGGDLTINAQYEVVGSGVMFVLKNGADIFINGGADINLTAIQASDLMARGISAEQANLLAGMLIFEDRESGDAGNGESVDSLINGNANTVLNGIVYLPISSVDFMGTASVTSQCLMLAAATINITGDANMATFCPADQELDDAVLDTSDTVKLVA